MDILQRLKSLAEPAYADFQSRLIPNIARDSILGIRIPLIRALAKEMIKEGAAVDFLSSLPHRYYDENVLHSVILSQLKDFKHCLREVESFLPYIDNWAVCDVLSPKIFSKHKHELLPEIKAWIASENIYTCRFGVGMLMGLFLDEDFDAKLLELPVKVKSQEYYVNMMLAWFYATALAKHWDESIIYLQERRLSQWVHQKTIQKARESYRITVDQKAYLKSLKWV